MKTIVIGVGNTIFKDDGVGIYAVREIRKSNKSRGIDVRETSAENLNLVELLSDYERAIIIDSFMLDGRAPGNIYKKTINNSKANNNFFSGHTINLFSALEMGKLLRLEIPDKITIFSIEVKENRILEEGCSPEVEKSIPKLIRMVEEELSSHLTQYVDSV